MASHEARERISRNIATHGHHTYLVSGAPTPRWAYTIGLGPRVGFELVLAGASTFSKNQVLEIIGDLAANGLSKHRDTAVVLTTRGSFGLAPVDAFWSSRLLLGARDYYQSEVAAIQIVPVECNATIDTPDLSRPLAQGEASPWRWLDEAWPYEVSDKAEAMTDIAVLKGERVTEVARWEEGYWEAFSGHGDGVTRDDARLVPLGTLLASDQSLEAILQLRIGQSMRRGHSGDWLGAGAAG